MKSKTLLLVVIGILAALCAGFLIGIMVDYPKPEESGLAGTFGKAEKFHKVQMTAKDVQLRTDLVKDTAKLKEMIQGLVYFSVFTEDLSANVNLAIISFKSKGMGNGAGEAAKLKAMQDYADFIRNNNKALNSTISMLSSFYFNDSLSQSQDVEKNMGDFGNYVSQLTEKDKLLNEALLSLDNFMLTNKTLMAKKEEISNLKAIRDQLLIMGVQLAGMLQDKPLCTQLISYALSSQNQYDFALRGTDKYNSTQNPQTLNMIKNAALESTLRVTFLESSMDNIASFPVILSYYQSTLQFAVGDGPGLSKALQKTSGLDKNLQIIVVAKSADLNVALQNYALENVLKSTFQSSYEYSSSLGAILAVDNMQSTFKAVDLQNSLKFGLDRIVINSSDDQ